MLHFSEHGLKTIIFLVTRPIKAMSRLYIPSVLYRYEITSNTIAIECAMSNIVIPHANGDYAYASFDMSQYYGDMVVQGPCSILLEFYYLLP